MESTGGSVSVSGVLLGGAGSARPRETSLARLKARIYGSVCPLSSVYASCPHASTGGSRCPLSSVYARVQRWFKQLAVLRARGPPGYFFHFFITHLCLLKLRAAVSLVSLVKSNETKTTLSGGSLGSCVDEERSQLRELM